MSFGNIKSKLQSQDGFTIVELLIVVVVIAILAAITIVSYNGITSRANASSAASNAETVLKVAEAYNADGSVYPTTKAMFTSGYTDTTVTTAASKLPTSITLQSATITAGSALSVVTAATRLVTASNGTSTVEVYAGFPTAVSTVSNGGVIITWDYGTGAAQLPAKYTYYGGTTSASFFRTVT
ncbi:MAG: prepilin-type N-terminal cleavage/methylation domain-containing protein [Patescibacteria group bacterium]